MFGGKFLALPNNTEKTEEESDLIDDQSSSESTTLKELQNKNSDETITDSPVYLHIHLPEESGEY